MQKILGLLIFIFWMFSENCFAMQFSQPVKIGRVALLHVSFGKGIFFDNVTYNNGNVVYRKGNTISYGKGLAYFGEGIDVLYVHYNQYLKGWPIFYFGDKNISNIISDKYIGFDIFKINTNKGITIYPLYKSYGPEFDYLIIGKRVDGKFVKYIDTREITKRYFGWNMQGASPTMYKDLSVQGDTLVMKYHDWKTATEGRFIFKWDDNAQWFSVDRTVDNVRSGY